MELAIVVEKLKNTIDALPPNERGMLDAVVSRMATLKGADLRDATPPETTWQAGPETDEMTGPTPNAEESESPAGPTKPNLTESESPAPPPKPNLTESEE